MSFQQLMETRKAKGKANVQKITTTKELMQKLNIPCETVLADRIVNDLQESLNKSNKRKKHVAIVKFEELDLTATLIVKVDLADIIEEASNKGSRKYEFEIKDQFTHYGKVSVYTANYETALRVIDKYLEVAKNSTGRHFVYKCNIENIWKEGRYYGE